MTAASGASSVFAGFRLPREVISVAVRWYLRYGLSYRDVEELFAEHGVTVDHVTIYRWVQRFTPEFVEAAQPSRHAPGDRWFVDETYVKVAGQWTYLYRAVDQHGQVIDVLPSPCTAAVQQYPRKTVKVCMRPLSGRPGAIREGHAGAGREGRPVPLGGQVPGQLAEMAIEYTGFQRPFRLASTTRMAQAEFSGTLTFEPAGAGTRLRWSWDARFTWPLRLLALVLARVGGRQERAKWAGLKRYLESSQHTAGPGAGEQPGPAPAAAADGSGSQPPGQGRAGAALLATSVAGVALTPLPLRRLGRGGSLLAAAGYGALFARDAQMTLTGAPARLRPLPRLLLRTEVPVPGSAAGATRLAWRQHRPGVARLATVAAAATFAVHAVREAIYLSPGHGIEEPAAQ